MRCLYLMLFLLFVSCGVNEDPDVIPKDKMLKIMEDVFLIENHYQLSYGSPSVYKVSLDSSYTQLLKSHGVSKKQYEESFTYYAHKPEILLDIQQEIIANLNRKRNGL